MKTRTFMVKAEGIYLKSPKHFSSTTIFADTIRKRNSMHKIPINISKQNYDKDNSMNRRIALFSYYHGLTDARQNFLVVKTPIPPLRN